MTTIDGQVKKRTHPIATSANGKEIYADLMGMPLAMSISRNPHLLSLVEEALASVKLNEESLQLEHDMGRMVGYCELVETSETDTVFYARQTKNGGFVRFVKNRPSSATQNITISLSRDEDGDYEVHDVWIGRPFPPIPGNPGANEDSKDFWTTHAVVYNGQALIGSTLTKDSPY